MSRFTAELEGALDVASMRTSSPKVFVEKDTNAYVGVSEIPEDKLITFCGPQKKETEVCVYTTDDLRELLSDPLLWAGKPVPSWRVDGWVRHEGQHADAAAMLAARGSNFGVDIVSKTDESVEFIPFFHMDQVKTCKLGMAAICAHPVNPSESDVDVIKKLGFSGPVEVARRALDYNYAVLAGDREGPCMPVSLACSSLAISYAAEKRGQGNDGFSGYSLEDRMPVFEESVPLPSMLGN